MAHIDIHDFRHGKVDDRTPRRSDAVLIDDALRKAAETYQKETSDPRTLKEIAEEMAKPGQIQRLPDPPTSLDERRMQLRDYIIDMIDAPITKEKLKGIEAVVHEFVK